MSKVTEKLTDSLKAIIPIAHWLSLAINLGYCAKTAYDWYQEYQHIIAEDARNGFFRNHDEIVELVVGPRRRRVVNDDGISNENAESSEKRGTMENDSRVNNVVRVVEITEVNSEDSEDDHRKSEDYYKDVSKSSSKETSSPGISYPNLNEIIQSQRCEDQTKNSSNNKENTNDQTIESYRDGPASSSNIVNDPAHVPGTSGMHVLRQSCENGQDTAVANAQDNNGDDEVWSVASMSLESTDSNNGIVKDLYNECFICATSLDNPRKPVATLPFCMHPFHKTCLDGMLKWYQRCPVCYTHIFSPI